MILYSIKIIGGRYNMVSVSTAVVVKVIRYFILIMYCSIFIGG